MVGEDKSRVERRQHPRYPIVLPVAVRIGPEAQRCQGTLMDLSRGGLFLKTKASVELGRSVEVSFRARPSYACRASGRISRVMDTRMLRGFSVGFDSTNDNFEKFLAILERLKPEVRSRFLRQVLENVVDIRW